MSALSGTVLCQTSLEVSRGADVILLRVGLTLQEVHVLHDLYLIPVRHRQGFGRHPPSLALSGRATMDGARAPGNETVSVSTHFPCRDKWVGVLFYENELGCAGHTANGPVLGGHGGLWSGACRRVSWRNWRSGGAMPPGITRRSSLATPRVASRPPATMPAHGRPKRWGWDSNPRYGYPHSGFQDRLLRPLGHPTRAFDSA